MRILTLRCRDFGALDLEPLRFSTRGRLQLLHGPNEAGKSTTMRAIRALVRGMVDEDSSPRKARNATVLAEVEIGGQRVEVERRGMTGPGVPPTILGATVHWPSVARAHYEGIWCIDHEALRRGGEAMLRSDAELGGVLLRSIVDGERIDAVHGAVRRRLEQLFNPSTNAKKQRLNDALLRLREARKSAQSSMVKDGEFQALHHREGEAAASFRAARRSLEELETKRGELQVLLLLAPWLDQVDTIEAEYAALRLLGPVPSGPAAGAIRAAKAELEAAGEAERVAQARHAQVEAELGSLLDDAPMLALAQVFEAADRALAVYRQHLAAAPDLENAASRAELDWHDARSGLSPSLPAVIDLQTLRSVVERWEHFVRVREEAASRHAKAKQALLSAREALASLPPAPSDEGPIQAAVQRLAVAKSRWIEAEAQAQELTQRSRDLDHRAATLGFPEGMPASDPRPLRPDERRRWTDRWAQALDAVRDAEGAVKAAEQRVSAAEEQIVGAPSTPGVPNLDVLAGFRHRRDQSILATLDGAGPGREALLSEVRRADEAADLRFAAADALTRLESAKAAHRAAERARESAALERDRCHGLRVAVDAEWAAERAVRALPTWSLDDLERLSSELDQFQSSRRQIADQQQRIDQVIAECVAAFGSLRTLLVLPQQELSPHTLGALDYEIARKNEAWERDRKARAESESTVRERQAAAELAALELASADQARVDAARSWRDLVEPWSGPTDGLVVSARNWVNAVVGAVESRARWERAARDLQANKAARAAFVEQCAALQPLLPGDDRPEDRVEHLRPRMRAAKDAALLRARASRALTEAGSEIVRTGAAAQRAAASWNEALTTAGLDATTDVVAALSRSDRAVELESNRTKVLASQTEAPDAVRSRLAGRQVEELAAELSVATSRRPELQNAVDEAREAHRLALEARSAVDGTAKAAEHQQEALAQAGAAKQAIVDLVHERAVAWLLDELQESLAEAASGPVRRAGELFAQLTGGAFQGFEVQAQHTEGRTVRYIVAKRDNGERLGPRELSDGTRDAMWLALRLAAIEAEIHAGRTLPVVLDDVGVHLSDDRMVRVLEVCHSLAERTQVLLFTHHRAVVELAQRTIPEVEVLELRPRPLATAPTPRDAPPPEPLDAATKFQARALSARPSPTPRSAGPVADAPVTDDPAYAAVLDRILAACGTPLARSDLVDGGFCTEAQWGTIRARLEADPRIQHEGEKRGRRYRAGPAEPSDESGPAAG